MNIFSKLFDFIKKLLRSIMDIIKKLLPLILLCAAIWLGMGMAITLPYFGTVIAGGTANALLAAGASFLLAPQETAELVSRVTDGLGNAAKDVLGTVVDVAGSVVGDILGQPVVLIGLGLLAWYFLSKRSNDDEPQRVIEDDARAAPELTYEQPRLTGETA